jgi:RNA polymerase sigma-70 factor (sigma-E family)
MTDLDFAAFVRLHTPALLSSAYVLTGSRSAAEDLVQDTFVRLYPQWWRVAETAVPIAYVRRSMMNNFLNTRRGAAAHEVPVADPPSAAQQPDIAGGVSDRDLVRSLLATLPPRSRAVLVLRFLHDVPDAQIAAELGCRPATVRSIVSRSLAALRVATSVTGAGGRYRAAPSDGTIR